jgi:hypothetical protein
MNSILFFNPSLEACIFDQNVFQPLIIIRFCGFPDFGPNLLIVGCFLDMLSSIIINPVLWPIAAKFGIDPIHFGIIYIFIWVSATLPHPSVLTFMSPPGYSRSLS